MKCHRCMEENNTKACTKCGYINDGEPNSSIHLIPGTIIKDQYEVGVSIGSGGFGVTYIAYDLLLKRRVAIKEYFPSEFATRANGTVPLSIFNNELKQEQFEKGLERFIEEGQKLAKFNHVPGVVSIYDCFVENSTGYIVMEYLEGITLKEYIKQNGVLSYENTLEIMLPIMDALEEVHESNLIHRDIAPDNIYLTTHHGTKLLDFGAARYATTSHSKSLSVILKLGYAPEEQYQSKGEQGPWSDVYALCATMIFAMTGKVPQESVERLGNDKMLSLSKLGIKVSKNVENTILNGMNIRHDNRIQSMKQLKDDLLGDKEVKRIKEKGLIADIGQWPKWMKIFIPSSTITAIVLVALIVFGVLDVSSILPSARAAWVAENNAPRVINYEVSEAEKIASDAGFQLTTAEGKVESNVYEKDYVISQNLEAGKLFPTTEPLIVTISAGPEMIPVDYMMDRDVYEAKEFLESQGFIVEIIEVENDEYFPNAVISQSVDPYTTYGSAKKIVLEYATGNTSIEKGKDVKVPSIVGMDINEARKTLMDSGLFLKLVETEFSDSDKDINKVMNQKQSGNLKTGDFVEVVISKGIYRFYMPDVELQTKDNAVEKLIELGIDNNNIEVKEEFSQTVTKGQIISQSIEANTSITVDEKITLTISKGPEHIVIPDLEGMYYSDAHQLLLSLNFPEENIIIETKESNEVVADFIISQNYSAGKNVKLSSTITLVKSSGSSEESSGENTYIVPNLSGMETSSAKQKLMDLGVPSNNISITKASSETVHSSHIMGQSYAAGKRISIDTKFTLVESTGGKSIGWVSVLPSYVNEKDYEITTTTQYRTLPAKTEGTGWSQWQSGTPNSTASDIKYRYRVLETDYKTSNSSTMSGYTQYKDPTTSISNDCSESTTPSSSTATTNVTTYIKTTTQVVDNGWRYYGYFSYAPGATSSSPFWISQNFLPKGTSTGIGITSYDSTYYEFTSSENYSYYANGLYQTPVKYVGGPAKISSQRFYRVAATKEVSVETKMYKTCKINYTYYFKKDVWSSWINGVPSSNTKNTEVQYSVYTDQKVPNGNWSEWSQTPAKSSDSQFVETRTVYTYTFK